MEANIHTARASRASPNVDVARPGIAVVPYGLRPDRDFGTVPLTELDWPLGLPDRLAGRKISDLSSNDHLIFYPSSNLWLARLRTTKAQISMMIVEPFAIHRRHMILSRLFYRKFAFVLTCNPRLLNAIPNGIFLPFGTSWVPEWQNLSLTKRKDISLIASNKRDLVGHRLRHQVARWAKTHAPNVELLGRAYEPFEKKADALAPYRYSVVIENVREPSYFTEKLIDALLCKTVPIYWGAPNIGQFFDTKGMVICNDFEELKEAVTHASDSMYAECEKALSDNQKRAAEYMDLHERAADGIAARLQETSL